jgi:DNA-directed RNA polymerase III subunit RPC4
MSGLTTSNRNTLGTSGNGHDAQNSRLASGASKTDTISSTQVKQEPTSLRAFAGVGALREPPVDVNIEIPEPIYPEEREEGSTSAPRVDIAQFGEPIYITSDEDEDPVRPTSAKGKEKATSNAGGLRPVRLARVEHRERVTTVNTEPAAASLIPDPEHVVDDDIMVVSDDMDGEPLESRRRSIRASTENSEEIMVQVKPDPSPAASPTAEVMYVDADFKVPAEQLTSVQLKVSSPEAKLKSARKFSNKDKKPDLQTAEEKAEYERHAADVELLADELNGLQEKMTKPVVDGEEDIDMEVDPWSDSSRGLLYLLQFPPILPPLLNPIKVKEEKADIEMLDVKATAKGVGNSKTIDVGLEEEVIIKADPDADTATQGPPDLAPEPGCIGKLVVRKSGKVELNWGGTSLQVGIGSPFNFLTSTVLIDGEKGLSMGPLRGKLIVTPDFSKMF